MNNRGLTLLEIVVIVVVIGILAALLTPCIPPTRCGISYDDNLRQLYVLGTVYASTHKGNWPDTKGGALWMSLAKTSPPLIEPEQLELLGCPVRGDWEPGQCDYLGPGKPLSELKPGDAVVACKPGNHGDAASGNVLLKDGSVVEVPFTDPIWKTLAP